MAKVGCPTKFNRVVANLIISMFRDGLSKSEIVKRAGIDEGTLREWANKDKEFSRSINKAMDRYFQEGPEEAIKTLIKGYTQVTYKTFENLNEASGEWEANRRIKEEKHIGPDYKAIRFCLQNRFRRKWNRKIVNIDLDVSKLSDKELLDLTEEAMRAMRGGKNGGSNSKKDG